MMKTFYISFQGVKTMININKIKVAGFRNLKEVEIETENITSLLSINSYGKSNFLNAIIFGFDFIHLPIEVKNRMMDYDSYKPYNSKNLLNDFQFEVELSYDENEKKQQICYGFSFEWKKKEDVEPKIVYEYLKIKDDNSQKYAQYINRTSDKAVYKSSITGACNKNIKIENNELVINKIMAYDELYYLDLIKDLNSINVYVDKHFNTNAEYNIQTRVKKDFSDYNLGDGTNVPRILFKLKNEYPNKFELILNTLKDIFPFIRDIKPIEYNINSNELNKSNTIGNYISANNVYFLVALDKNLVRNIDFSSMSDGVRRVLLIFTTLVIAEINHYSLVGIEEPENSLNPKILQRYLMALKSFSKNTKIIMTSHSPHLINYMDPKNIYIGLPNNDGIANFSKIKEKAVNKLLADANNMDMLVGDYLFDLMSGSEDDLEILSKYVV